MKLFFLLFFLLMGVSLYWGSIRLKKKPYTIIQGDIKLSKMILSPEKVQLYADNKYVIINFRKKEKILQVYEQLKDAIAL